MSPKYSLENGQSREKLLLEINLIYKIKSRTCVGNLVFQRKSQKLHFSLFSFNDPTLLLNSTFPLAIWLSIPAVQQEVWDMFQLPFLSPEFKISPGSVAVLIAKILPMIFVGPEIRVAMLEVL
jgi:hypothetical protein